jgi:Domain of unknown function (DUF6443)
MRKAIFTFILLGFFGESLAQNPQILIPIGTPQGIVPKIIPPSPEASSLAKYAEWPVSLSTGTPNISLPLYQFSKGEIAINIGLSYHASGIRMDEMANWTGLGWTLNAGGAITRTLRGRPDDDKTRGFLDYTSNKTIATLNDANYLDISDGCYETQPDLFNLNINGITAQICFDWNSNPLVYSSSSKLIISYIRNPTTGYITSWEIIDDKGLVYTFADIETSNNTGPGVTGCSFFNNYTSAWYISSIRDMNNDHQIDFIYDTYGFQTKNTSHTYKYGVGTNLFPCLAVNTLSTTTSLNAINGKRIKEIHSNDGTENVYFNKSITDRLDTGGLNLAGGVPSNFKYLDNVEIRDLNNKNVKSYTFDYENLINSRLVLLGVQPKENNQNASPPYLFEYNARMPEVGGFGQDHWGFNNGAINPHLIPYASGESFYFLNNYGLVNREPSEAFMLKGIINKIKYPTGGTSVFEFEANTYQATPSNPSLTNIETAGGARIKRQKLFETDGINLAKDYTYTYYKNDNALKSSGKLMADVNYIYDMTVFCTDATNTFEGSTIQYVKTSNSISGAGANHISYSEVQTKQLNGADNMGKTISMFSVVTPSLTSGPPLTATFASHYSTGLLLNQKEYAFNNPNYTLVKDLSNTYYNNEINVPVFASIFQGGFYYPASPGANHFVTSSYQTTLGFSQLKSKTETSYFPSGNIINTKELLYTPDGKYIKKEKTNTSDFSENNITEYFYPFEFLNPSPAIANLVTKNHLSVPLETIYGKESDGLYTVLEGQLREYEILGPKLRFSKYFSLDTSIPLGVGQFDYAFDNTLSTKDPKYTQEVHLSSYDARGNVTELQDRGKPIMSYLYGYNLSKPIAEARNINILDLTAAFNTAGLNLGLLSIQLPTLSTRNNMRSMQNSIFLSKNAFLDWFAYDPLVGLSFSMSENGLENTFSYDINNRLEKAFDHDGNIVKQNQYQVGIGNSYIRSFMPRQAMILLTGNYLNFSTNTQFLDGLGRPLQSVSLKASPDGQSDIISGAVTYDSYGRTARGYIPFSNMGNGSLAALPATVHGDSKPFSYISQYDNSPLNRPLASLGVGEAWHNAGKTTNIIYDILPAGNMPLYTFSATGAILSGTYNNSLYMTTTIDEQGNASIEYKDNEGKTVQKAVEESTGNYLRTYYIYDAFDRLIYIIQPESFNVPQSFIENDNYFTAGVFAYHYDLRGRVYESHVPGGGWSKFLYDKKDRQVMSQDALQATLNKWNFTKYDVFDRVVMTGEMAHAESQTAAQTALNTHPTPNETWTNGTGYNGLSFPNAINPSPADVQMYNFHDQYNFRDVLVPSFMFDATTAFHTNYSNVIGQKTGDLSYNSADHNKYYTTVNYYDNKARQIQSHATTVKSSSNITNPNITNLQYNYTGEEIYRLETANFPAPLTTQTTRTQTLRDHVGRPTLVRHGINTTSLTDFVSYTYDAIGRQTRKSILPNGTFSAFGALDYINRPPSPALGTQDIARKAINLLPGTTINPNYLGLINPNATGGNIIKGLQHIDYNWHIRGTLLGLNLDPSGNATPNNSEGDLFSNKYEYETQGQYGGNIAKQTWTAKNLAQNNETRAYTYSYDKFDRLKSSIYTGIGAENYSSQNISYDRNGNIKTFIRNGVLVTNFGAVDNLAYSYLGNKLLSVTDAITGNASTKDFRDNSTGIDYTYWPNGTIKSDANRGIDSIVTNTFLKKTSRVKYADGKWINFIYDGDGMLIRRQNSISENWEYTNTHTIKNNSFYEQKIPEGRAAFENNNWNNEFEYRDIFGNLRVSFAAENGALVQKQRADYDAFGWIFNENVGNTKNYRQFQNQNRVEDFGLDIDVFKYRASDPQIGRLWSVDPLASSYVYNSPYALQENKFGRGVELEGLELLDFLNGTSAAIIDNVTLGVVNQRANKAENAKDQSAFSFGEDIGDALSASLGMLSMAAGGLEVGVTTIGVVSAPAASIGIGAISYGTALASKAIASLAARSLNSQGGRGNNNNKTDAGDGNNKPTKTERAQAKKESKTTKDNKPTSSANSQYNKVNPHKKNPTPSNKRIHEKGQSTNKKNQGGEKADIRRDRYK